MTELSDDPSGASNRLLGYPYEAELELLSEHDVAESVLEMVMAADHWVHRRIEQVEIQTITQCLRKVSLDLTVPKPCAAQVNWLDGSTYTLIPVDLLAKGPLQRFSISDADGLPLSTLTRRQNGEVAYKGLSVVADKAFHQAGLPTPPRWVENLRTRAGKQLPAGRRHENGSGHQDDHQIFPRGVAPDIGQAGFHAAATRTVQPGTNGLGIRRQLIHRL